jgi:excisionase family DNA binding protein
MANESEKQIVWLSIRQSAELKGVHQNTIRNRIADKTLPAMRLGRNIIRINQADLDAIFTPYRGGEFGIWSQL